MLLPEDTPIHRGTPGISEAAPRRSCPGAAQPMNRLDSGACAHGWYPSPGCQANAGPLAFGQGCGGSGGACPLVILVVTLDTLDAGSGTLGLSLCLRQQCFRLVKVLSGSLADAGDGGIRRCRRRTAPAARKPSANIRPNFWSSSGPSWISGCTASDYRGQARYWPRCRQTRKRSGPRSMPGAAGTSKIR